MEEYSRQLEEWLPRTEGQECLPEDIRVRLFKDNIWYGFRLYPRDKPVSLHPVVVEKLGIHIKIINCGEKNYPLSDIEKVVDIAKKKRN